MESFCNFVKCLCDFYLRNDSPYSGPLSTVMMHASYSLIIGEFLGAYIMHMSNSIDHHMGIDINDVQEYHEDARRKAIELFKETRYLQRLEESIQ